VSAVIDVLPLASKTNSVPFKSIDASCNATVPVAFGNVITWSAVGFT
jgi:hypothetical protein